MTTPTAEPGSPAPLDLESAPQPGTRADWERAAAGLLRKGRRLGEEDPDAAVVDRLSHRTLAGVTLRPVYGADDLDPSLDRAAPGSPPYTRGRRPAEESRGWDIRVPVSGQESAHVAGELAGGATSLWLHVGAGARPTDLETALGAVDVARVPVVLEARADPATAARALVDWLEQRGLAAAPGTSLGADPLGAWVREGVGADLDTVVGDVLNAARTAGVGALVVDATAVHDLGAAEDLELGYSLAAGAAYLRAMEAAGCSVDEACGLMEFRYAATDDQFLTIAKLRAARLLWHRVSELSGASVAARGQRQHAVTSRAMMSRYDPYVNMLRTTVAAFAAGVGGADAVTVLPFDSPLGRPEELGRRIARNTSSLLLSEAHVGVVADPAGGSYAVESLTQELADAAWELFGEIEAADGVTAALANGWLAARLSRARVQRAARVNDRTQPITGLTEFPQAGETLLAREPDLEAPVVERYGAAFEEMRDLPTPRPVFVATMGSLAAHTPRARFATNLLAAGGVPVVTAGATDGVEQVLEAYDAQPVVCLAGPDAAYAEWGAELVAALRGEGARHVILAGAPGSRTMAADLLDDACALGVDALAFLRRTRAELGVTS